MSASSATEPSCGGVAFTCQTVDESMMWARQAVLRIKALGFGAAADNIRGSTWTMSSSCSGIQAPELAMSMIAAAMEVNTKALWAAEKDVRCQKEILASHQCPDHVFGDLLYFLDPEVRTRLLHIRAEDVSARRDVIFSRDTLRESKCLRCKRVCSIERAHIHVARTPCVHDNPLGHRGKLAGEHSWILFLFCKQRRDLREPVWIHENVPSQGDTVLRQELGDIYRIERVVVDCQNLGWSSRRLRQFVIGTCHDMIPTISCMPLGNLLGDIFERSSTYGVLAYCVSTDEEVEESRIWAASRKEVARRHGGQQVSAYFENALIGSEFQRLTYFREHRPDQCWDLGQDVKRPSCSSLRGPLQCLTKHVGIIWVPGLERFLTHQDEKRS